MSDCARESALKKARRKAQTGAAKLARKKSMKLRRKRLASMEDAGEPAF